MAYGFVFLIGGIISILVQESGNTNVALGIITFLAFMIWLWEKVQ